MPLLIAKSQLPQMDPRDALRRSVVLQTKVDAHCDKLATVVGRTNLTTLAAVDVPWPKSRIWDKVPEGGTLISGAAGIPFRRISPVLNKRVDFTTKASSIPSAVWIQYRLVTDRRTDTGPIPLSIASRG